MSLGRKATIGAGWLIAWRALSRLLGVANTILLARLLVPSDFGLVAMAMSFEAMIVTMTQFPVQDALLRRPEGDTLLHDAAFTMQAARAILLALVLAAAAPLAARWFSEPRLTALLIAIAATTAINGFHNVGMVQFGRELRFDVKFKLELIPTLLQVGTTVVCAWLTHSYWSLVVGLVAMRVSRALMTYMVHPYRPHFSLQGWRQLIGFSFWLWLAGLAGMVLAQVDTFVIGPVFGAAALGLYMLANQLAALPTTELIQPVSSVLLASFAYAQRERATSSVNPLMIAAALLVLLAPMALVISAGAGSLVPLLLGAKWLATAPLVAIAASQCLFEVFNRVTSAVLIARGHVRSQFVLTAIAAFLRSVLIICAALIGSLTAVVLASVAAVFGYAAVNLIALRADLRRDVARFVGGLARIAIVALASGLILAVLSLGWAPVVRTSTHFSNLIELCRVGAIVALVYFPALVLLWLAVGLPDGPENILFRLVQDISLGVRSKLKIGPLAIGASVLRLGAYKSRSGK